MPLLHTDPTLPVLRSSAAEVLACVVLDLFPQAVLVGGDATDSGFFYDFIIDSPLNDQILELLEMRMRTLLKEGQEVRSLSFTRENASSLFLHNHQAILAHLALLEDSNIISVFQLNKFYGLCPEPHINSTDELGFIKLLEIEKTARYLPEQGTIEVQRIRGTVFTDPSLLKQFVKSYEKLEKIDHRIFGPELNLYKFFENSGSIECFWLPKGNFLREALLGLWENECQILSIKKVTSPLVVPTSFLKNEKKLLTSFPLEEDTYTLSRLRLPHHIQIFNYLAPSEFEYPVRFGEVAQVYEKLEEPHIWGLFRGQSYQTDLVSSFCREEQVAQEINYSLHFIDQMVTIFGFEAHWYLVSSESKNSAPKAKKKAIEWLKQGLESHSISYKEAQSQKDPHIEVRFVDFLGREWVGPSIEVAISAKEKLKVVEGVTVPVVLTRSLFGSLDRFIGLLIEHYKGAFPFWLAPEQVRVLSMGESSREYAEFVCERCRQKGWRANIDSRDEKLGTKIHAAEKEKVPFLLIIGEKEVSKNQVSVRSLNDKDKVYLLNLEDFLLKLEENYAKSTEGINIKLGVR